MDTVDVIVIDEEDGVTENKYHLSDGIYEESGDAVKSDIRILSHLEDKYNKVTKNYDIVDVYEQPDADQDVDDVDEEEITEYNSKEDGQSGDDDNFVEGCLIQGTCTSERSQCIQTPKIGDDMYSINENISSADKEVDEDDIITVNSHLKEIVDIKNQIRELQDILHNKTTTSGEKLKFQDEGEDSKTLVDGKLQDKSSSYYVQMKRNTLLRTNTQKSAGRLRSSQLFKRRTNKMPMSSSRFEERVISSKAEKVYRKRAKHNEMVDDDVSNLNSVGFPQYFQKKKLSNESSKSRIEKKRNVNEDIISEDAMDSKLQEIETIPPSITTSLRKILQMTAHTPEEKYKVLDARDKLYKIMRDKDPTAKTGALVGTCPDMCPEKERLQREFQFQVSIFEMINYPKNTSLNHNHAVKRYCRSSADQEEPLPHELRSVNILTMTMSYLLHNIADYCELSDDNLEEWYMFMWDRTRALRKELTQQGVCNVDTVKLVEQCARFHIHCAERLVDQDSSIYDDKINTENLTKCLQTLKYMYKDLANEDVHCPNESEFVCYSLLLNLNNTSVFTELSDMSERLMSSQPVRFALDVMTAWETRNYVRFFNLINRTTYLNCCILRRYFNEMRMYATKTMIRSYCTKYYSPQISVYRIVDNLNFEGVEDCCNFLSHCILNFKKGGNDSVFVNFNKSSFRNPENAISAGRAFVTIEGKKRRPLSVVMAGGELPPKTYEDHVPQNSFTENGELKLDSLLCKDLLDFAGAPPALGSDGSTQSMRSKGFETKEQLSKPSNDSSMAIFPEVFAKSQRVIQNFKDAERMEKNTSNAEKYYEGKVVFSRPPTAEKPGNTFGNSTCGFGQDYTMSSKNKIGGDAESTNLARTKTGNIFSESVHSNKDPIFPTGKRKIFQPNAMKGPFCSGTPSDAIEAANDKFPQRSLFFFNNQSKSIADSGFKFKLPSPPPADSGKVELVNARREKAEVTPKEKQNVGLESEVKKRQAKEQEEKQHSFLIDVRRSKQETEEIEKEKKEAEEKRRKEREKREREKTEEKNHLENLAKQETLRKEEMLRLEKMAKMEEAKRKSDADHKLKVEKKMSSLKCKYVLWKAVECFNKWRLKTWVTIEKRKMQGYFKESLVKYPPICTDEHLNGNPYGLVIPNVLNLRNCQSRKTIEVKPRNEWKQTDDTEFSSINLREVVTGVLEKRTKRMYSINEPFLWKIVFSTPDSSECSDWKNLETFVEMHFVRNQKWEFGKEKGPLYYEEGCRAGFHYKISVRKVRGLDLYEGVGINTNATSGSNGLVFLMSDNCDVDISKERLRKVVLSRSRLPQIPLIVCAFGDSYDKELIEKSLELDLWTQTHISEYHVEQFSGHSKEEVVSHLVKCITVAADKTAPVTTLRISRLLTFYSTDWFEMVWRRIATSLSNYKIVVKDPNFLIECYNSCVDILSNLILDCENDEYTLIGDEFVDEWLDRPSISVSYKKTLLSALENLKLPRWPKQLPKNSHQLKYRIHQYCRKITNDDKRRLKELKWLLYRIIRRSLMWKGLDIYCDEDIESILLNFPWIQLFQEFSRFLLQESAKRFRSENEELIVTYRLDKIQQFTYESTLIGKFLKSKRKVQGSVFDETDAECIPQVEQDSVIFAYSAALERDTNKRKREVILQESLDDLYELAESKRLLLEEEDDSDGRVAVDIHALRSSFQSMNERLDEVKKRMEENARALNDLAVN